jgi:hypothetical protein
VSSSHATATPPQLLALVGCSDTLGRPARSSLHHKTQECQSAPTRRAELISARLRIANHADPLHVPTNRRAERAAKICRIIRREIGLAEVAEDGAGPKDFHFIVRVLARRELAELVWVVAAIEARRHIDHLKRRIAERTVRFRHATMVVAA